MLPFLKNGNQSSKKYIVQFGGLNLGEGYSEGEFSACKNLSSAMWPCISQRFGRTQEAEFSAPEALHTKAGLMVIDGTQAIYKGEVVGSVADGRKQIATVGNIIVIFPDKLYYNIETGEFGSMEEAISGAGMVFTHNTITLSQAVFKFRVGDAVTISGCATEENNLTIIVRGVEENVLTFYDNSFTEATETGEVSIKREVPDLEYICESNYRLWGVMGNSIYGSKYADPFNFQVFDGLTGDSYYIDVCSDGEWTGCIPYSSHICFFKENTLHKLYGAKPSNYQVVTTQIPGIQRGSERSLCTVNEMLLYKGVNGVYAYSGGVPELISTGFGLNRFSEACGASDGERYYISMRKGDEWHLMAYDLLRGVWLQEDDCHCVDMAYHEGYVYMLCADGRLLRIDESTEEETEWSATFCPFNETVNERKGYSKFHIRMELAAGAYLTVEMRRDNAQRWEKVYTTHNERARTISIPVLPARCDSVEIRISGKGECLLRTFVREFFTGSDV